VKICQNCAVLLGAYHGAFAYQFGGEIENRRSLAKAQHPFLQAEMACFQKIRKS
jgi:hypothetical protein